MMVFIKVGIIKNLIQSFHIREVIDRKYMILSIASRYFEINHTPLIGSLDSTPSMNLSDSVEDNMSTTPRYLEDVGQNNSMV